MFRFIGSSPFILPPSIYFAGNARPRSPERQLVDRDLEELREQLVQEGQFETYVLYPSPYAKQLQNKYPELQAVNLINRLAKLVKASGENLGFHLASPAEARALGWEDSGRRKAASDRMRAWKGDPASRVAQAELLREQWQDPAYRAKMSALSSQQRWSDERRQAVSDLGKARWKDPELRKAASAQTKARWTDPEFRKTVSDLAKARWKDTEYRAQVQSKRRSPERHFIDEHLDELKKQLEREERFDTYVLHPSIYARHLQNTNSQFRSRKLGNLMSMARSSGRERGFRLATPVDISALRWKDPKVGALFTTPRRSPERQLIDCHLGQFREKLKREDQFETYKLFPSPCTKQLQAIYPQLQFIPFQNLIRLVRLSGRDLGFNLADWSDKMRGASDQQKARWQDPEYRERTTEGIRRALRTPEHRQLKRIQALESWKDPRYRNKMIEVLRQALNKRWVRSVEHIVERQIRDDQAIDPADLMIRDEEAIAMQPDLAVLSDALHALERIDPCAYLLILSTFNLAKDLEEPIAQMDLSEEEQQEAIDAGLTFLREHLPPTMDGANFSALI